MVVFIRKDATAELYGGKETWVPHRSSAVAFRGVIDASLVIRENKLRNVSYLISFGEGQGDVLVPIRTCSESYRGAWDKVALLPKE